VLRVDAGLGNLFRWGAETIHKLWDRGAIRKGGGKFKNARALEHTIQGRLDREHLESPTEKLGREVGRVSIDRRKG